MQRKEDQPTIDLKVEQYLPEAFLEKLYETTLDWLINEQEGEVVAEFEPQKIFDWESYESDPGRLTRLDINLVKAVLVKTPKNDFALVLGRRRRSKYDHEETLGLQFGLLPISEDKHFDKLSSVDRLRSLTYKYPGGYGTGDFYQHSMTRSIQTDCWADGFIFGGQRINTWGKEKLLTPIGINACLEIIQRTTRNAFT